MLEPQTRRLLLESLRPPQGYRLDWALSTTYSLDLISLLTTPIAFAFNDCQDRDGKPHADPLALMKAVREYAGRICISCQAGKIHVPSAYQPLLAGLEDSIVQARAPKGGSFHPKLWFLRYVADGRPTIYRLLCSSRNLTFDRSWDTLLCLEGELTERTNAFKKNHPLGEFVEDLRGMAIGPISVVWLERIEVLANDIRRVEFEVPQPFMDMEFWPLGHPRQRGQPLSERMDRALIVSPFVDDARLQKIARASKGCQLVSRPECLDLLSVETLADFQHVWILDDMAEPESGELESDETSPETGDQSDNHSPVILEPAPAPTLGESPLIGLHAKVYVTEAGWDSSVWIGSANATSAAFGTNVEFMVHLRAKKKTSGIDSMLGTTDDGKSEGRLINLLQPYQRGDNATTVDGSEQDFERRVDLLATALARCLPLAHCKPAHEPETFRVTICGEQPISSSLTKDLNITCQPASLAGAKGRRVLSDSHSWVEFGPLSLLGLTSFFVFVVEPTDGPWHRQFVLQIPLQNPPANRSERILQHLLSDPEKVMRYLLLLLTSHDAEEFAAGLLSTANDGPPFGSLSGIPGATLFESLLRVLSHDPQRIDQVKSTIDDLRQSPEGARLLPPGLDAIWEPIWQVREKSKAREAARAADSVEK